MSTTWTPQQLVLIKQLYEDACILAAREDDLSLTKSLILLDLSVEQMLNQILRDFNRDFGPNADAGRRDMGWQRLWQLAVPVMKKMGSQLMNYRELSSLHEQRNLTQHNASIPTHAEVNRYVLPAGEMMSRAFKDLYNQQFDTFTLWELIQNEGLRQLLQDSEYALNKGCPEICVAGCNLAHRLIVSAIRSYTKLRRFRVSSVFPKITGGYSAPPPLMLGLASQLRQAANQLDNAIRQGVEQFRKEILAEIEFLEDEVVAIGVGMPLMDTRRFQKIGSEVPVSTSISGDMTIRTRVSQNEHQETAQGARFMLNYLSRLVRLVDEAYPGVLEAVHVNKPLRKQKIWNEIEGVTEPPNSSSTPPSGEIQ